MSQDSPGPSTFERSCQHWSEQGREEMEAFYRLATTDYRLLAEELDWGRVLADVRGADSPLRLLDVACGSGQFPAALLRHGGLGPDLPVAYSLLDPSEFSIETARGKLEPPFAADDEYLCRLQDLTPRGKPYPLVWATHALYCVPPGELPQALRRLSKAMDPAGLAFIAQASRDSHYVRFHELYLRSELSTTAEPFTCGEEIVGALQAAESPPTLCSWTIEYEGRLPLADRQTAERYLQRCLFDDSVSLETMLADPKLGPYLDTCKDPETRSWRFPQRVWLILFGEAAANAASWRRRASGRSRARPAGDTGD